MCHRSWNVLRGSWMRLLTRQSGQMLEGFRGCFVWHLRCVSITQPRISGVALPACRGSVHPIMTFLTLLKNPRLTQYDILTSAKRLLWSWRCERSILNIDEHPFRQEACRFSLIYEEILWRIRINQGKPRMGTWKWHQHCIGEACNTITILASDTWSSI